MATPQQPNAMLADWLEKGLNEEHHWLENYARLWTLGRTGNQHNLARVRLFLESPYSPLNNLAYEVYLRLGDDDDIAVLRQNLLASLPSELFRALAVGDTGAPMRNFSAILMNRIPTRVNYSKRSTGWRWTTRYCIKA